MRMKIRTPFADRLRERPPHSLVGTPVTEDTLMYGGTPWLLPGPAPEADAPARPWDDLPADRLTAGAADAGERGRAAGRGGGAAPAGPSARRPPAGRAPGPRVAACPTGGGAGGVVLAPGLTTRSAGRRNDAAPRGPPRCPSRNRPGRT